MAKATKREKELASRLHRLGLRKRVARNLAQASVRAEGQIPPAVRTALGDLRAMLGEVGVRDGSPKRKQAAKKAAQTRKRNDAKRSTAARKAAKTRAQNRDRSDAMLRVGS